MNLPIVAGLVMQRYKPTWAKRFRQILRPLFIFFIIFAVTFGFWVNWYLVNLFTLKLVVAGCLLPYMGFLLGGVVAALFGQNFQRIITIALETGIQVRVIRFFFTIQMYVSLDVFKSKIKTYLFLKMYLSDNI